MLEEGNPKVMRLLTKARRLKLRENPLVSSVSSFRHEPQGARTRPLKLGGNRGFVSKTPSCVVLTFGDL
jgi:hypothetical protein